MATDLEQISQPIEESSLAGPSALPPLEEVVIPHSGPQPLPNSPQDRDAVTEDDEPHKQGPITERGFWLLVKGLPVELDGSNEDADTQTEPDFDQESSSDNAFEEAYLSTSEDYQCASHHSSQFSDPNCLCH